MSIRWRLAVLAIQLSLLVGATFLVLGNIPIDETWCVAGLLAIVINRQLLEPFYSRPGDVIANSVVGLALWASADRAGPEPGWDALLVFLLACTALGLVALVGGAGRTGSWSSIGGAAAQICQRATAQVIYSAIFWVALLGFRPPSDPDFWWLAALWFGLVTLGSFNWQRIWSSVRATAPGASIEGLLGPNRVLVSAPQLPAVGCSVDVAAGGDSVRGVVSARIHRRRDVWAETLGPRGRTPASRVECDPSRVPARGPLRRSRR